jgi:hypothetical protein
MNKKLTLIIALFLNAVFVFGQDAIDVTDQTIKIGSLKEEEFYFGFAAGDKIVFSFQEINYKELKEIEILEYPESSKFSDYKTSKIENKTINVTKTGIYLFRFKNSAIAGRICKVKIQRIPQNDETKHFNTNVTWITKQDTIWNSYTKDVTIGYDTSYVQKTKKELVKIDTIYNSIYSKTLRVHSKMGSSQYTNDAFTLPINTYIPNQYNPYKTTELIAWSYWIGVGQEATKEYEKLNKDISETADRVNIKNAKIFALAQVLKIGSSTFNTNNIIGSNVYYEMTYMLNGQRYVIEKGDVTRAFGKNELVKQGAIGISLYNDNFKDEINVSVEIASMQVTKEWQDIPYTEQVIKPIKEKQIFKEPKITSKKIPVIITQ